MDFVLDLSTALQFKLLTSLNNRAIEMNYIQLQQPKAKMLEALFAKTFGDSEGLEEGKAIGQLARDLIETTNNEATAHTG
jgi:hypothetical protein